MNLTFSVQVHIIRRCLQSFFLSVDHFSDFQVIDKILLSLIFFYYLNFNASRDSEFHCFTIIDFSLWFLTISLVTGLPFIVLLITQSGPCSTINWFWSLDLYLRLLLVYTLTLHSYVFFVVPIISIWKTIVLSRLR